MNLGEKLKKYRKENGLTQKKLAEKCNIARSTLSDIENGTIKGTVSFITKMSTISNKPLTYWADEEIESNYRTYEALDVLIEALIDSKHIQEDGKIQDSDLQLIKAVLEKEIKLKIKKREK